MTFVLLEYLEPASPGNRRVWDPCEDGNVTFEATDVEAAELRSRLGAASPFRVVPVEYAIKAGLLRQPTDRRG